MQNSSIDALCRGEGEYAMLEMCDCIDAGKSFENVEGLWVRTAEGIKRNPPRKPIENLDSLPLADRELYQKYGYFNQFNNIDVLAGRACPFGCSYCYNHVLKDIYPPNSIMVRKHSVDRVISELEELKAKYKPVSFSFSDELFSLDKNWLREFSVKYREKIGLPFACSIRADTSNEDTVELLASAGVSSVCFGLETGNERLRSNLLNKPIKNEQIVNLARLLHARGIKFLTSNMFGLPGETLENAFETVELNHRIKTDYLYSSIFQPYPKLRLTEFAESEKLFVRLAPSEYNTTFFKSSMLKQDNMRQLENLHRLFYLAVRWYWLRGIIKLIIKLPANFLFDSIFILNYTWIHFSCFQRDLRQLFAMGSANLRVFYSERKQLGHT